MRNFLVFYEGKNRSGSLWVTGSTTISTDGDFLNAAKTISGLQKICADEYNKQRTERTPLRPQDVVLQIFSIQEISTSDAADWIKE